MQGIEKRWSWASFSKEEQRAAFASFSGQKVSIHNSGMQISDPAVFIMRNKDRSGLSEEPNSLCTGANSGYQALNLAVLAGAKRVLLVGYDMRFGAAQSHSHNGHPIKTAEACYVTFAKNFASMLPQLKKLSVEVINCNPKSAIGAFRKEDLASVLAHT
jgi:hypothetical protein